MKFLRVRKQLSVREYFRVKNWFLGEILGLVIELKIFINEICAVLCDNFRNIPFAEILLVKKAFKTMLCRIYAFPLNWAKFEITSSEVEISL